MSLVFGALVAQMATLSFLLLPLPHVVRKNIVALWGKLQTNANYKVGVIFVLSLMILQFLDCVQKLKRIGMIENPYYAQSQQGLGLLLSEKLALKFYAQRNLYLSGAVLYLSMAINVVLSILTKLVAKEKSYRDLSSSSRDDSQALKNLTSKIKQRDADISAMKKQIEGMQKAYDSLNEPEIIRKDD